MFIKNLKKALLFGFVGVCMFGIHKPAEASVLNGVPYYDLNIKEDVEKLPYMSDNKLLHVYGGPIFTYHTRTVSSYLNKIEEGYERIEYEYFEDGGKIYAEEYSENYELKSRKSIEMELPIYGGVYSNNEYRYVICGQYNMEENDAKEVIRIIQYSKNWERIKSTSIYGANTITPFDFGTVSFAEKGDYIYVRTAHVMYTSSDGLNHQACMAFVFNSETLEITDKKYTVGSSSQWGYTSHSFNQLIIADGDDIISVDHGDAYPRAVRLSKFSSLGAQYPLYSHDANFNSSSNLLSFRSTVMYQQTNASVGSLTASDTSYMVVGDYLMNESDEYKSIWLSVASKSDISSNRLIALTDGTEFVTTPVMVKIKSNKFLIMWNVLDYNKTFYNYNVQKLQYLFVDGNGNKLTDIMEDNSGVILSDCNPILSNGKVIWYTTNAGNNKYSNSVPIFYELDTIDYHIDKKNMYGDFFYKDKYDEHNWADIYYIDVNGDFITGFADIREKKYLFGSSGGLYTGEGLYSYEDDLYYIKSDHTVGHDEFFKDEDGLHYILSNGAVLKNASKIRNNVKYFFDERGYVEGKYNIKDIDAIITYNVYSDDVYGDLSPSDFTYKKKLKVKRGSYVYLSNASLDIRSISRSSSVGGYKEKKENGIYVYKIKDDTTIQFGLQVNGKLKEYKVKIKVKK